MKLLLDENLSRFYWPELDVDLRLALIESPENLPLKAK